MNLLEAGLLGIQGLIPPFSNAFGSEILKGVNYASGGAGLLSESGSHLGDRIWLARQVSNYGKTIEELGSYVEGPVTDYLSKCLYTMNIGSNDYINNYFMPQFYSTKNLISPDLFAETLVAEYEQQLKQLYESGARKTAIFGLSLIGCIPMELRMNNATFCVKEINKAVHLFNQKLLQLVDSLNVKFVGAKFTFIDIAAIQSATPIFIVFSFTGPFTDVTCCKIGSDFQCEPSVRPCHFRKLHAFMDGIHPTETANLILAKLSFYSPLHLFVHPVDINTLANS
ncbi:hypothetical protein RND81_07G158000 [Saponaria officinalis]|uniref:GDSL esterase/lipase n=1 Tax=Saponaria officinalis TaxID=3572 RepID=A0AAW1JRR9_SAPOF